MLHSSTTVACLQADNTDSEEVRILVDGLARLPLGELLDIPGRPDKTAMQEFGLLGESPNSEGGAQVLWLV